MVVPWAFLKPVALILTSILKRTVFLPVINQVADAIHCVFENRRTHENVGADPGVAKGGASAVIAMSAIFH